MPHTPRHRRRVISTRGGRKPIRKEQVTTMVQRHLQQLRAKCYQLGLQLESNISINYHSMIPDDDSSELFWDWITWGGDPPVWYDGLPDEGYWL